MKRFLLLIFFGLIAFGASAQKISVDELANRNEHLENLLLDYKEKLIFASTEIARLKQQNEVLKWKINVLLIKEKKTDVDIYLLKQKRKMLLLNNQILKKKIAESKNRELELRLDNQRFRLDNQLVINANKLLEGAANAADTIQKYQEVQIKYQEGIISKMTLSYAEECARLTGIYKVPFSSTELTVLLDEGTSPKPRELENMTISACYQLRDEMANDKIIVYFQLYDNNKREVIREVAFPLNRTNSQGAIYYYEGDFTLPTNKSLQLNLGEYFYEVKYLEQVIASGHLKSS